MTMRIVMHDYGGYPFTVQLARSLANRGHEVLYLHGGGVRPSRASMAGQRGGPAFAEPRAGWTPRSTHQQSGRWATSAGAQVWTRPRRSHPRGTTRRRAVGAELARCSGGGAACGARDRRRLRVLAPGHLQPGDRAAAGPAASRSVAGSSPAASRGSSVRSSPRCPKQSSPSPRTSCPSSRVGRPGRSGHVIPNWAPLDEVDPCRRTTRGRASMGWR